MVIKERTIHYVDIINVSCCVLSACQPLTQCRNTIVFVAARTNTNTTWTTTSATSVTRSHSSHAYSAPTSRTESSHSYFTTLKNILILQLTYHFSNRHDDVCVKYDLFKNVTLVLKLILLLFHLVIITFPSLGYPVGFQSVCVPYLCVLRQSTIYQYSAEVILTVFSSHCGSWKFLAGYDLFVYD